MASPDRAVGVDGCRQGWLMVEATLGEGVVDVRLLPDFAQVIGAAAGAPVAVDMPVGLVDAPRRSADVAARRALPGRASSVFAAPPRPVITALRRGEVDDHAGASALARSLTGQGLSMQTWRICPKVAEVDAVAADVEPTDLWEVHPEVSFAAMALGAPLARKRTYAGVRQRLDLLAASSLVVPATARGTDAVAPDDVLDAMACCWTALALASGEALVPLPDPPTETDGDRPIAIWTRHRPRRPAPGAATTRVPA